VKLTRAKEKKLSLLCPAFTNIKSKDMQLQEGIEPALNWLYQCP